MFWKVSLKKSSKLSSATCRFFPAWYITCFTTIWKVNINLTNKRYAFQAILISHNHDQTKYLCECCEQTVYLIVMDLWLILGNSYLPCTNHFSPWAYENFVAQTDPKIIQRITILRHPIVFDYYLLRLLLLFNSLLECEKFKLYAF